MGARKQKPSAVVDLGPFDATLAEIDTETAHLTAKQAEMATTKITSAQAALDAEQEAAALAYRRDVGDETGLDAAIEAADARADAARRAHRRAEHNQRAAAQRLAELAAEGLRVKQDRGRAARAALEPVAVEQAAAMDDALAKLIRAATAHREIRLQMLQLSSDHELPEREAARLHDFRHLARKIGWELATVRLADRPPSAHYVADVPLAEFERDLHRGAVLPEVDVEIDEIDDEAEVA